MKELKIGVYVCHCGTNIAKTVDVAQVRDAVAGLGAVTVARDYKYMCSNPGQAMIANDVKELGLTRVVVAACSPRMHERTFRTACRTAGINPFLFQMANIREHCSWIHSDRAQATEKATALARAAVERVRFHEPLATSTVSVCPSTLVLGGGVAGLTAAIEIADAGHRVYLVEKADRLGGNLARLDSTAPHLGSARDLLAERLTRVAASDRISVLLGSRLAGLTGFVGNFKATLATPSGDTTVDVGNVVVATGFAEFDAARASRFGYGTLPDVVTSFELERMLRAGRIETKAGRIPRHVALVHCVGSRSQEFHPYCSRVCCMTGLKYAVELRSALPECRVAELYVDMHAFRKGCEELYRRAGEAGTMFLMYEKNDPPAVRKAGPGEGCEMLIEMQEAISGERVEVPADLVVLLVGMEARKDSAEVARLVNISRDRDGWFIERHPKLNPVATTTDGIFVAGTCAAPKDIPDTVAQAGAAAARIMARIATGKIEIDGAVARVREDRCSGCGMCVEVCAYKAIEIDARRRKAAINAVLCKGCGTCAATCRSTAIEAQQFSDRQLLGELRGVMSDVAVTKPTEGGPQAAEGTPQAADCELVV